MCREELNKQSHTLVAGQSHLWEGGLGVLTAPSERNTLGLLVPTDLFSASMVKEGPRVVYLGGAGRRAVEPLASRRCREARFPGFICIAGWGGE